MTALFGRPWLGSSPRLTGPRYNPGYQRKIITKYSTSSPKTKNSYSRHCWRWLAILTVNTSSNISSRFFQPTSIWPWNWKRHSVVLMSAPENKHQYWNSSSRFREISNLMSVTTSSSTTDVKLFAFRKNEYSRIIW